MLEAVRVVNEPKVKGLSFNLFAIIALLVILPVSTAFISNLANSSGDYESISSEVIRERLWENDPKCTDNTFTLNDDEGVVWLEKGFNSTNEYEIRDNTNDPYLYDSIWDKNDLKYYLMHSYCGGDTFYRNDVVFSAGVDNHRWLYSNYQQGNSPNYNGFIGYTGTEYAFRVNTNYFQYLDDAQDISGLNFQFVDYHTGYNRSSEIFQQITLKMSIELNTIYNGQIFTMTFDDFETTQLNRKCYQYANQFGVGGTINLFTGTLPEICHIALDLKFEFTTFEIIEISEILNRNYDEMFAKIYINDIIFENNLTGQNQFKNNIFVSQNPLPFAGDDNNGFNFEVKYANAANNNFVLKGGTFVLGIGLFALAIANTPYWNPVINFFKEGA